MSEQEEKQEEEKDEAPKEEKIQIFDLTEEGASKNKELRFTKRFRMRYTNEDGEVLDGEFTIKRPNLAETARIGVIMAELREDKPVSSLDRTTLAMHEWIATCQIVVTKAPPWWNPEEMYDSEPLQRVFAEALAFQNSFRTKRVVKRPGEAASGSSSEAQK